MGEKRHQSTNRQKVIARVRATLDGSRGIRAQIGMRSTAPSREPRFGKKASPRSAGENLMIYNVQKKKRRNPVVTRKAQDRKINEIWMDAIHSLMKGERGALDRGGVKVGKRLVRIIHQNIDAGTHIRGKMKKLEPWYDNLKKRKWGNFPILEASGQLKKAFRFDIARL